MVVLHFVNVTNGGLISRCAFGCPLFEEYSEEIDLLVDPALEGTPQQYDCYYDVWQVMAAAAATYEASKYQYPLLLLAFSLEPHFHTIL